jgi:hypothetical protein
MKFYDNKHYSFLRKSYDEVGLKTWLDNDFIVSNLTKSIDLFTEDSILLREPVPKNLEVYALLSGLSFKDDIVNALVSVQQQISDILGSCLHYYVLPENFGVEYCVFKWPDGNWDESWADPIKQRVALLKIPSYKYTIRGIQINPDGCIVAKGYDEGGAIFTCRETLKKNLSFLPARQSGWSHVPIGRILEPIGVTKFEKLKLLIDKLTDTYIVSEKIETLKLIHEKQWYMERRTTLAEFHL